jgi:DNA-binding NarL/FixJ family response regulator
VIDLRMPTMDGFEATQCIVQNVPETRVMVVSSSTEPEDVTGR